MKLNFKQFSDQGEPLIMMHGLFGSLENLAGIAKLLADEFTVYSLDMRNHGRSGNTDEMTLAECAQDVVEFLDTQGIEQANLWGHSLGGKVMMELALTHPRRVKSLVVADIAPVDYETPRHEHIFAGLKSVNLNEITSRSEVDEHLKSFIKESQVRSFILKNLYKAEDGSFGWRANLNSLHSNYRNIIGPNRHDQKYTGPVLFLKGAESDYISPDHREAIGSRFPNADLKIVSGTGHWLHAAKPTIIARLTRSFLQN